MSNFTITSANKALKQAGFAERLVKGRGYYYFTEGDAMDWYSSSIMTNSIAAWTAEKVINERNSLASDWRNSNPHAKPEAKPETATLSKRSAELFRLYADDAANWSGMPLVGGNVGGSKADRGNLTQLKQAGLITTQIDEGNTWINFTAAGKAYALTLGIELENTLPGTDTVNITITPSKEETTMKNTKTAKTAKTTVKTTATKTVATKSAKPKSAPAKAAKTVTATRVDAHPFLSSEAAPLVCVSCGAAPSGKLHRRYMDAMRRMWKTGSAAERESYLTHIEDGNAAEAKLTWTALPAYTKRALAACLNLEAE